MKSLIAAAAACAILAADPAAAADWRIDGSGSYVGFVATYDGIPFEARFESFDADIRFDPENLQASSFDVSIDAASLDSGSRDRDEGMRGSEWFGVEKHPTARFHAERFEHVSGHRYRALGELVLKGTGRPVELPFTWQRSSGGGAVLSVETELDRRDFDVGSGDWAQDDIIGFAVSVEARLELSPR